VKDNPLKTYHLTPTESGWVLAENGHSPLDVCWTKWQALERATEESKRGQILLTIHNNDGTVEDTRCLGPQATDEFEEG
jgi:hypothetical protein